MSVHSTRLSSAPTCLDARLDRCESPYPSIDELDHLLSFKRDTSTDDILLGSDVVLDPFNEEGLTDVCTDGCRSALESLRTTVLGACNSDEDVMVVDGHAYPGMPDSLHCQ